MVSLQEYRAPQGRGRGFELAIYRRIAKKGSRSVRTSRLVHSMPASGDAGLGKKRGPNDSKYLGKAADAECPAGCGGQGRKDCPFFRIGVSWHELLLDRQSYASTMSPSMREGLE